LRNLVFIGVINAVVRSLSSDQRNEGETYQLLVELTEPEFCKWPRNNNVILWWKKINWFI